MKNLFVTQILVYLINVPNNFTQHKDLLQQMLEATGEEGEEEEKGDMKSAECPVNKKNRVMTDADVLANCIGIILSGHETTSTTLSFASYLLALHPDIQEKLQSEIDMYFDDNPVRLLILCVCTHLIGVIASRSLPFTRQHKRLSILIKLYRKLFVFTLQHHSML
jgi:cytochrome P450